ncbi:MULTISPECIES: 6-carboxytetrahydropterin synthase QueD [unclassified Methylophaga]|jgi:6-pyruvoyltetrahydropterin/6-carboxytetrahydropterin synthase|uniref:6-carboxytetrahydropterin synthase QueD n=1 Tax=unclassified Methylophaga TaxID=2629249 RepID=UPI000C6AF3E4|nr:MULTISPECIES: 6-carboxytetrahydropterin synthase QueD [unclassified Methylophaga]MBN15601.1 6-carboxytetrahydropterin synthase QueD [Pelagibacterium sp.]MAL48359.1 6-carboxytetrahydropterin synthase QueD [Methylophaga sp.]MAP27099.1 6-carboxytetrahydropterin synthase QueD [Methylophaga sp.]MBP24448.1 6-carboxytetrahydropterin synthase QueD [Methylophaga sp.]HAD30051.1 6-carboxytetrahydropterin synthase QueD [Methylophaga sp.]|tara:strand:+ start:3966 stop:4346 length:381 start_codon:yes stop_codon:yes gene_type:complete
MSATYTLKILADFASAHTLRDYPGDCRRMHGHNWKLEVEVTANALNQHGMGMDFKTIKTATRELAKTLDHRYLNDIPPFDEINPTAENIAQFFYQRLSDTLNTDTARVSGVTVWETDRACVKYSED